MGFIGLVRENAWNAYKIQNLKKIHAVLTDSRFYFIWMYYLCQFESLTNFANVSGRQISEQKINSERFSWLNLNIHLAYENETRRPYS